ncbi:MAG: phage integrase SAM-like domain-containing protein [Bacteroidetes bacterium]|nr:phage integrase SAM-like domain-containing protein [Bacteroidota bacterium]
MKTNNIRIYPRTEAKKKDGSIPVYLRITINRHPVYYSLQVSIPNLKCWDDEKKRVRRNSITNYFQDNNTIDAAENRARAIIQEFKDRFKPLTPDEFRRRFVTEKDFDKNSFYDFCTREIKYLKTANFSADTIRGYTSYVSKMKAWKSNLSFSEINDKMRRELNIHMIQDLKNMENTRQKMFAFIKSMLNRAKRQGIIDNLPFQEGAPAKKRQGKREFLTPEGVKILPVYLLHRVKVSGPERPPIFQHCRNWRKA